MPEMCHACGDKGRVIVVHPANDEQGLRVAQERGLRRVVTHLGPRTTVFEMKCRCQYEPSPKHES